MSDIVKVAEIYIMSCCSSECSALELAEFSYFMNNRFDPSSAAPIRGSHQMVSLVLIGTQVCVRLPLPLPPVLPCYLCMLRSWNCLSPVLG
jgi:hypothetical protein